MQKSRIMLVLFGILVVFFIFIESKGLSNPQPGDENAYFYMGKLASESLLPYKDFFYAHPPLHLLILAVIFKLFGFNIIALKLIPLISAIITALLIFQISKKFGYLEAFISSMLFLFSYSVLFNSVLSFGVNTATMLLMLGVYFYYAKNKYFTAGIFFGLAGITKILTLIPVIILLVLIFLFDKRKIRHIIYGFSLVFISVNLVFTMLFGFYYINPVYKFHLLKSFDAASNIKEYINVIKLDWILFLTASSSFVLKNRGRILDFKIILVVYLLALAFSNRLFHYYFIPAIPFLSILGSHSLIHILKKIRPKRLLVVTIIVLALLTAWDLRANMLFLGKVGFNKFERGEDIVGFINSKYPSLMPIFGDDSSTPLIALMSGRKILYNMVDTNPAVFKSGIISIDGALKRLEGEDFLFIVRGNQGISGLPQVIEFLNNKCSLDSTFKSELEGTYFVYHC